VMCGLTCVVKEKWGNKLYTCDFPAEYETNLKFLKYLCKDHAQLALCAGIKIKKILSKPKDIWDLW